MSPDLPALEASTSLVSRRTLLRVAAAAVPAAAVGVTLPQVASAAPVRPSGSGYVRWEDLYRSGDSFQAVVNKVTKTASSPCRKAPSPSETSAMATTTGSGLVMVLQLVARASWVPDVTLSSVGWPTPLRAIAVVTLAAPS